jgi:alanine racemase
MHPTILEIDKHNLLSNILFFKEKLKKQTKILAVVKAYTYGSDAVLVSKSIQKIIDYFAVAYTKEGIELKRNNIEKPIIVLHTQPDNFKKIIEYNLEPNIYSINGLLQFIKIADNNNCINYPIHLKFNTGLNRLGFKISDIDKILSIIKKTNSIKIKSILSHLVASEDLNEKKFTLKQINDFKKIKNIFDKHLDYKPLYHILNTSGVVNYPDAQFDMVRIGIGMFGFANDKKTTKQLKSVLSLKTRISQIHNLNKGESVGYNRAYFLEKNGKTATLPIGHADGVSRKLGNNNGFVYVNNKKAPIIGNVCMDMIMIDVTNIKCNENDTVYIFKSQTDILKICDVLKTIPYEFLTMLSQRIDRKLKD